MHLHAHNTCAAIRLTMSFKMSLDNECRIAPRHYALALVIAWSVFLWCSGRKQADALSAHFITRAAQPDDASIDFRFSLARHCHWVRQNIVFDGICRELAVHATYIYDVPRKCVFIYATFHSVSYWSEWGRSKYWASGTPIDNTRTFRLPTLFDFDDIYDCESGADL